MKLIRELVAIAGIGYMALIISASLPILPAVIPVHFNAAGMPNGFGPKESLWLLPVVALFVYGLLSGLSFGIGATPLPAGFRAPTGPVQALVAWLKAEAIWTFAYIVWGSIQTAEGHIAGLSPSFAFVPVVVMTSTVVVGVAAVALNLARRS